MPPLIGIIAAANVTSGNLRFFRSYAANVVAVECAGAVPFLIPADVHEDTLRALYERADGILLPGGGDIDPQSYGAERHAETSDVDYVRDRAEITIARWAVEEDRPLFCICRGHQLLNVALGGTLIQDISSLVNTSLTHRQGENRQQPVHSVDLVDGSCVAQILGATQMDVNSIHHQAIDRLAEGLWVTGHAEDGIIEAVELPDHHFVLGVQWHPEDMQHQQPMRNLFAAFAHAANGRA